jgi:hypothetical protein
MIELLADAGKLAIHDVAANLMAQLHSALHCKNHRPYNSLVNDCLLRN